MKGGYTDITGRTFGNLRVVRFNRTDSAGRAKWLCRCTCGNRRVCVGVELRAGRVKDCRSCARKKMGGAGIERRVPVQSITDPDAIIAKLTHEQRARYNTWEAACRKLGLCVPPSERLQILGEIIQ